MLLEFKNIFSKSTFSHFKKYIQTQGVTSSHSYKLIWEEYLFTLAAHLSSFCWWYDSHKVKASTNYKCKIIWFISYGPFHSLLTINYLLIRDVKIYLHLISFYSFKRGRWEFYANESDVNLSFYLIFSLRVAESTIKKIYIHIYISSYLYFPINILHLSDQLKVLNTNCSLSYAFGCQWHPGYYYNSNGFNAQFIILGTLISAINYTNLKYIQRAP